jgi:hypothetical protein
MFFLFIETWWAGTLSTIYLRPNKALEMVCVYCDIGLVMNVLCHEVICDMSWILMWWMCRMRYLLNLCDEVYVMNAIFVKYVWWSVCDEIRSIMPRNFLTREGMARSRQSLGMTAIAQQLCRSFFYSGREPSVAPENLVWLMRPLSPSSHTKDFFNSGEGASVAPMSLAWFLCRAKFPGDPGGDALIAPVRLVCPLRLMRPRSCQYDWHVLFDSWGLGRYRTCNFEWLLPSCRPNYILKYS